MVEWDKDDLDALGILKIDVLALGMLTCIRKAFELLERHYGKKLDLATIPAEDPAGLRDAGPGRLDRRVPGREPGADDHAAAPQAALLLRPRDRGRDRAPGADPGRHGPSVPAPAERRGAGRVSLRGAQGRAREDPGRAALPGAGDADRNRRRGLHPQRIRSAAPRHGDLQAGRHDPHLPQPSSSTAWPRTATRATFAERCFQQIEGFGTYGFPESHAASFALLVYVSAWLKCHHPEVFACALLNSQPMGFYAPAQIVRDARDHGVAVLPVDVNASDWDCTLEVAARHGGSAGRNPLRSPPCPVISALRLGFRQVKGLKAAELAPLALRRGRGYLDLPDLRRRSGVSAGALDRLARADAFGSLALDPARRALEARSASSAPATSATCRPCSPGPATKGRHSKGPDRAGRAPHGA